MCLDVVETHRLSIFDQIRESAGQFHGLLLSAKVEKVKTVDWSMDGCTIDSALQLKAEQKFAVLKESGPTHCGDITELLLSVTLTPTQSVWSKQSLESQDSNFWPNLLSFTLLE